MVFVTFVVSILHAFRRSFLFELASACVKLYGPKASCSDRRADLANSRRLSHRASQRSLLNAIQAFYLREHS